MTAPDDVRTVLVGACLVLATAAGAADPAGEPGRAPAARPSDAQLDRARQALHVDRKAIIARNLELTEAQGHAFWPLYAEYRKRMGWLDDQEGRLARKYLDSYDRLTDRDAGIMVEELMQNRRMRADIYSQYLHRFRGVIPSLQLARLMQIEHRLDVSVAHEAAQVIPLVPPSR